MAIIDSVKLPDNSTYEVADNHSGYAKKVAGATTDDLASLTATGDLADSGKKLSDLVLKADVKDVLNSTSTTDPLSANQGKVLADNLAANENVLGAKNLIPYPFYETTKSINGITFTDNGNGTVTVSGTASADAVFYCLASSQKIEVEQIINGCPSGGTDTSYRLVVTLLDQDDSYYGAVIDYGSGALISNPDKKIGGVYIQVFSGTAITTPITFKPMIRDARVIDPTFAPYAMTNRELTERLSDLVICREITIPIAGNDDTYIGIYEDVLINGYKLCGISYGYNTLDITGYLRARDGRYVNGTIRKYDGGIIPSSDTIYIACALLYVKNECTSLVYT